MEAEGWGLQFDFSVPTDVAASAVVVGCRNASKAVVAAASLDVPVLCPADPANVVAGASLVASV